MGGRYMSTKAKQITQLNSDWNQADINEPVFVLRARNWKVALIIVALVKDNNRTTEDLLQSALEMKHWADENEIPF
jgi:hypothetical protein